MARKKRRYDDQFRANAVIMVQAQGYPENKGAIEKVAAHLKVPPSTLRGWCNGHSNPPPADIRLEKKADLLSCIKAELGAVFNEMGRARPDASYRDLMVAAGILTDKWQLLEGEPDRRVDVTSGGERISSERLGEALAILQGGGGCAGCHS